MAGAAWDAAARPATSDNSVRGRPPECPPRYSRPRRRLGRTVFPHRNGALRDMGVAGGDDAAKARKAARDRFLKEAGWAGIAPVTLAGDASFRRYYRLKAGDRRAVLMDA